MFDLVLHLFQPEIDGGVRYDQDDQRNTIDHHEDEQIERDEQLATIVQVRAARRSSALTHRNLVQ